MSVSATPAHRYRFTIVIIALIFIMGIVVVSNMYEELSQYTPEELQELEFGKPPDAWLILSFISILAFVIFLSTPYGRVLSDMAMYG